MASNNKTVKIQLLILIRDHVSVYSQPKIHHFGIHATTNLKLICPLAFYCPNTFLAMLATFVNIDISFLVDFSFLLAPTLFTEAQHMTT